MMQVVKEATLSPEKFCYWLQGFCELHGAPPSAEQWKNIREHLEMVFDHAKVVQSDEATIKKAIEDMQKQPVTLRPKENFVAAREFMLC